MKKRTESWDLRKRLTKSTSGLKNALNKSSSLAANALNKKVTSPKGSQIPETQGTPQMKHMKRAFDRAVEKARVNDFYEVEEAEWEFRAAQIDVVILAFKHRRATDYSVREVCALTRPSVQKMAMLVLGVCELTQMQGAAVNRLLDEFSEYMEICYADQRTKQLCQEQKRAQAAFKCALPSAGDIYNRRLVHHGIPSSLVCVMPSLSASNAVKVDRVVSQSTILDFQ